MLMHVSHVHNHKFDNGSVCKYNLHRVGEKKKSGYKNIMNSYRGSWNDN